MTDRDNAGDTPEFIGHSRRRYSQVDPQVNPSADQSRPDYQPREGLHPLPAADDAPAAADAAAPRPRRTRRALPRSRVSTALWFMVGLVIVAAVAAQCGLQF